MLQAPRPRIHAAQAPSSGGPGGAGELRQVRGGARQHHGPARGQRGARPAPAQEHLIASSSYTGKRAREYICLKQVNSLSRRFFWNGYEKIMQYN